MKLIVKFNLILGFVFAAGLGIAALTSYRFLRHDAREAVLQQARLMMEAMRSARDYTTRQIKPLLETQQEHQRTFLPQTVPAFAATESFNYLRATYPDYAYKEATLNPTNLRDRAADWEADVINNFRNREGSTELVGERDTPTGRALFLARPIRALPPCLECHDRPKLAPAAMIRRYGSANGFGWQKNEIIGAQIVSVPEALPVRMADQAFRSFVWSVGGVFLACLVLLDIALLLMVVRPLMRLSALADQISLGKFDDPEIPVHGSDEIATLSASFTRMRRSLERAMKLLE